MTDKRIIAIDMDGVLANFEKRVQEIFGKGYKELHPSRFWGTLTKKYPNLYYGLEKLDDADDLINYIKTLDQEKYDIFFLGSLPLKTGYLATSEQDKRAWLKKHFDSPFPAHYVFGGKKKANFIKNPSDILIDDTQRNITAWEEKGGIGILHTNTIDTIKRLKELL